MIIDKLLSPAIGLALSELTVSNNLIGASMDMGEARNNGLLAQPFGGWRIRAKSATSGGAATGIFTLVTATDAALTSPVVLYTSPTYALASLAGNGLVLDVPIPETDSWLQYAAWKMQVGTAVYTAGSLYIEFGANFRKWRAYPAVDNQ